MKTYLIRTSCTMKPYNRQRYWIDSNIIGEIRICAESIDEAIKGLQCASEERGITISATAVKNKEPMYIDDKETGETQQVGYVFTGKTEIWDRSANVAGSTQYIDVWAMFEIVAPVTFD